MEFSLIIFEEVASLFMFGGKYEITFDETEHLYLATLGVAFRNRLAPGQFPYPFWHDGEKWATYENAKSMLLWIDPATAKVGVVQFSKEGKRPDIAASEKASPPNFNGKWLWADEQGKTQPAVTLFDGLFHNDNPYKGQLDESYRNFALSLRDGQCLSCHVPSNPNKMGRLVLLQSPAHAAFEIKRVLKDVREDRMPLDEIGIEQPLDLQTKNTLLEKGGAFEALVDAAREWEMKAHLQTKE